MGWGEMQVLCFHVIHLAHRVCVAWKGVVWGDSTGKCAHRKWNLSSNRMWNSSYFTSFLGYCSENERNPPRKCSPFVIATKLLGVSKRGSRYPKYPNFKGPISQYPNFKGPISRYPNFLAHLYDIVSFWAISQYPKSITGIPISLFLWANIPNSGLKWVISQYPNLS